MVEGNHGKVLVEAKANADGAMVIRLDTQTSEEGVNMGWPWGDQGSSGQWVG